MSIASPPPPTAPTAPDRAAAVRGSAIRDSGTVRRDAVLATTWTATGVVKVEGDVDVGSGTVDGLVSVGGRLTATSLRARGTLEVVGAVEVRDDLALDGTFRLAGGLRAGRLTARGTVRAAAPVVVDRTVFARGTLEAPSVRVGVLDLVGSAEIPGELAAAAVVRAQFRGDSHLGTVRAPRTELHGPPTSLIPTLWRTVFGGSASIHVDRIEADSVELSAVDVGFVHAREIVLGPGAHVTAVEGAVVRRSATSRIGPESRSPPPPGLRR